MSWAVGPRTFTRPLSRCGSGLVNAILWLFMSFCPYHLFIEAKESSANKRAEVMNHSKRHGEILRLLNEEGTITIASLADKLGVSLETIRRDVPHITMHPHDAV